jgi:DNA replication initiation complex subunit (GINS family)
VEVRDPENKKDIRDSFIRMIMERDLSKNIMTALGHSPKDPFEKIINEDRNLIWKLVDVNRSTGFKNGT